MSLTGIQWVAGHRADGSAVPGHVWNPVAGCTRASEGCDNCYAVTMTRRCGAMGQPKYQGLVNPGKKHFNGVVRTLPDELARPLRRRKPTSYFVNSMSDLFHAGVPFDFIAQVFAVMAMCPQHTFIILTKRGERLVEFMRLREGLRTADRLAVGQQVLTQLGLPTGGNDNWDYANFHLDPLPNVWLGVSVENQEQADLRLPQLLSVRAAEYVVSLEPQLARVDLGEYLPGPRWDNSAHDMLSPLTWVIVGGESGATARPVHQEWVRQVQRACAAAAVPFFFKQWGRWWPIGQIPTDVYESLYVCNRPDKVTELGDALARDTYGQRCRVTITTIDGEGRLFDPRLHAGTHRPHTSYDLSRFDLPALLDGVAYLAKPLLLDAPWAWK